jgi:DNA repair exonuclease SbcCD nuclease subunit
MLCCLAVMRINTPPRIRRTRVNFAEQLKRLADAQIPVVMVTGNHDIPASFGKASALNIFHTLGDQRYFFVAERPQLFRN